MHGTEYSSYRGLDDVLVVLLLDAMTNIRAPISKGNTRTFVTLSSLE